MRPAAAVETTCAGEIVCLASMCSRGTPWPDCWREELTANPVVPRSPTTHERYALPATTAQRETSHVPKWRTLWMPEVGCERITILLHPRCVLVAVRPEFHTVQENVK